MSNQSLPTTSRLRIGDLEKFLGFKWERTISRAKDRQKYPVIKDLNDELKSVTEHYSTLTRAELLNCTEFVEKSNAIFDAIGPRLWPDEGRSDLVRSQWLATAAVDNLGGQYPEDLYFAHPDHNQR
ncbi:hypothetical protein LTR78_010385 [Recurvomyces mirabilis]|uniref:Uncharacterized protein n=1 Tax=Recurvomyces mirabilis TaxID=574656 RepID=A0AAE0WGX4_9PEZI|nr:hypothetical protein LTR78_010385 [Recurvomyces mirabilis]KAK5150119.1 hypothetical protein LTS14_010382 [Recurvomyces mirabilis]